MNCTCNRIFLASVLVALLVVTIVGCEVNRPSEGSKKAGEHITNTVTAVAETDPVPQNKNEDSADDPAIWIDTTNVMGSFVIGTDKKGGLATYDLDGKQLNYYADGNMNNCDLRYGFQLGDQQVDVLAASNRSTHSLSLYLVKKGGVLEEAHARVIKSEMRDEVYGLCMYRSAKTGDYFVFMNSKAGEVEQWQLIAKGSKIDAKLVRSWNLGTQTEGMIADDETGIIYVGEEVVGIYRFDAEPGGAKVGSLVQMSTEKNPDMHYDIEGLAIYATDSVNGYLIASSQGSYSYAVFERQGDNKYLGSFRIEDGDVDGVEETDGIDITNVPLGAKFPKGMLVVQDGYNYDGEELVSQNFKYISWEAVEKLFLNKE
ncbi:phytase [Draconibacterium sp. IB214405]|uniref:phytase n=1 Tax=Draconibacterium sp. IB214405 TaxID=3097352 RepID=UPI002A15901E|nr:phytase [Draconibacterium sp. IB214405]MDX8338154.1 phytase [Draconibacterium sp. IB214405]